LMEYYILVYEVLGLRTDNGLVVRVS